MLAEFFVHNLGCKLNRVESDALGAALLEAGASSVARDEARVVVVNTCTVTAEADTKTRKAIRQALASPAQPWVIATGCAIAVDRESYQALGERVIAEPDRLRAQERALELLGLLPDAATTKQCQKTSPLSFCAEGRSPADAESSGRAATLSLDPATTGLRPSAQDDSKIADFANPPRNPARSRSRLGIKIQDGCDGVCSYCVVRIARGAARSVSRATVRKQVQAAEREGFREVVLTGVNIGSYSEGEHGLAQLVAELLSTTTELRIRLSSLEPQHADDKLLELMAASEGRLCAHLHLPLQSGCDRTLEAMARPYNTAFFAARVAHARRLMPQLALTTDVIVGFPDESDEDFEQSRQFCERMGFARMHVFRYSRRPRTPAATLPCQCPPQLSAERAATLRELAERMRQRDAAARVGTFEKVLVERRGLGTSESYHRVAVPASLQIGSLAPVRFTAYRDTLLQATV